MNLILASASPRRAALLRQVGFDPVIRPQGVDESRLATDDPIRHAARLAQAKATAAIAQISRGEVVIAADTVVHLGDHVLDKPAHRAQARAHLVQLSGREHLVTTGVCVTRGEAPAAVTVTTRVRFRALSDPEIDRYLATGEADDKAGAYGIQGLGGALVAELHGSYTNVVGLPLETCLRLLAAHGVSP